MSHKKKHTNDFGRDPIPGLVLRVSVPFMVAQFVNVFYSIADRIFIGNLPVDGQTALAGAGGCAPIVTLLSSFATLIGIGGGRSCFRCGSGRKTTRRRNRSSAAVFLF